MLKFRKSPCLDTRSLCKRVLQPAVDCTTIKEMNDVIQVRLGRQRAKNWKQFLQRTGLNQAEVIRSGIDAQLSPKHSKLPPVAARWCGKVKGPKSSATNAAVAKSFSK
jgi:hypothetical protein